MAPDAVRITGIETFLVAPRWLFCVVRTDQGIDGWGEPIVEGRAETVRTAVHELADYLVGRDPRRIEDHWQVLTRGGFYRGGPVLSSAVSGIDQALWDIRGKALGVPVHELLGGAVRDRIRVYSWVGGDDPSEVGEAVSAQVEAGFSAVKMNASGRMPAIGTPTDTAGVLARAAAAREVLGDDRDLALDFHGRVSPATANRLLPRLEDLHPLFVEEPVVPELAAEALPRLVRATDIPIAAGERAYSRWDAKPLLDAGVAVLQPDLSHAGGISEGRRIAALAEVYGASLAPHCPLGPIALASCLQVGFATPNLLIQEQSLGIHYNRGADLLDYLVDTEVFRYADGHVPLLTGPGLGIQVDEAAVRRADEAGHRWRSPVWRDATGAFTEW